MIEKIVRKEVELQEGVKLYSVPDARMSDEELREALHNDWDFANWEEPTAEMCQDMDIEPGIKTLILGGFDEFCFCPKEKIFPNVVELHICRNVSCIIIDPKAFPNIRKVTSESPYFLDSDMLVRLPDDIADMVMCDEISKQDAANMNRGILENVFCRRPDEVVDLNGIQEISGNCSFYGCETENIINTDSVTDCWLGSFYCFKPFNPNNKWNIEDKYKEDYMIGTILVMPYIEPGKDDKKTKYIFPDKKVTAIAKDDVGLSFTRRCANTIVVKNENSISADSGEFTLSREETEYDGYTPAKVVDADEKDFDGIWKADYVSTGNITAPVDVFGISGAFISVKSGKLELFLNSDAYEKPLDAEDLTVEFKDNACTFTSEKDEEKEAEKNAASSDADGDEKTDTSVNGALQRLEDDMVKMTINTGGSDMIFYLEKSDAVEMKAAKRAAEEEAEAADEETELETKKDTEKETKEETKKSEK